MKKHTHHTTTANQTSIHLLEMLLIYISCYFVLSVLCSLDRGRTVQLLKHTKALIDAPRLITGKSCFEQS